MSEEKATKTVDEDVVDIVVIRSSDGKQATVRLKPTFHCFTNNN